MVVAEKFSEKLKNSRHSYSTKAITSLKVMDELIKLAEEFQDMQSRNNDLGLNDDEVAFYKALATEEIMAEL